VSGSYGGVPEPVAHNGSGFHPSDSGQHDRR
jgi:hypothetical protein